MKKVIAALLVCIMTFSFAIPSFAATNAKIYAESVTIDKGTTAVTVPVLIENNPGLMGYKIIIRYDKGLVPVKVTQGEAIKGGNFNDSIETSDNNEFVVVWSNTADKKTNGKLFEIKFNVDSNIANDCEIKVSYSQPDTFNEKWQDVKLNCANGKVTLKDNGEPANSETPNNPAEPTFWQKVVNFFVKIWNWFIGLFN